MGRAVLILRLIILSKQLQNVEVLLLEMNLLLVEALGHDLGLLAYGLGAAIDLLEDDLHHRRLELGQHAHLCECLFRLPLLLLLR